MAPDEDVNRGPEFLTIFSAGVAVATALVFLRFWVRVKFVRIVGWDDWIVLAALVGTWFSFGYLVSSVDYGLGRHYRFLTLESSITAMKMFWIAMFITPFAEAFAKISISIMLIRITTNPKWKWFFYSLITLFSLVTVATLLTDTMIAQPINMLWDPTAKGRYNKAVTAALAYVQGVAAALYDVLLAVSPVFLLWNVQIDRQKKVALCGVLALGFFTSIAGILRTVYTPGALNETDVTYTVMPFLIWKCVELPLSIIVGCLPTLRPLVAALNSKVQSMQSRRAGYKVDNEVYILDSSAKECQKKESAPPSDRRDSW